MSNEEKHRDEAAAPGEQSKKGWKKVIVLFLLSGLIAVAWYFWTLSSGPAQGIITQGKEKYDVENPDLPPAIKEFKGAYFSLFLPESYEEKRHETPERDGNILEQAFFSQGGGAGRKTAITIEKRPQGGLEEITSYHLRELHPKEYAKDSFRWGENGIPIFKKNEVVYEVTGYLEAHDFVASISVSSAVEPPEEIIGDFSDIVKSFRWSDTASR